MSEKKSVSRLGGSPLNGMDLLSSTVEPVAKKEKVAKAVEVASEAVAPEVKTAVVNVPKAKVPKAKTPPPVEPAAATPPQTPGEQYGYDSQVKWPLLAEATPYLIAVPSAGDKILSTAFTMRLPVELDITVDAHCKKLRVNKSEWTRQAMARQLQAEQDLLAKPITEKVKGV